MAVGSEYQFPIAGRLELSGLMVRSHNDQGIAAISGELEGYRDGIVKRRHFGREPAPVHGVAGVVYASAFHHQEEPRVPA